MGRLVGLLFVALLAFAGWRLWLIGDKTGSFRKLDYAEGPACRAVTGAIGAEDLVIDRTAGGGLVFVAALDRTRWNTDKSVRGLIGYFSLTGGDTVVDLTDPATSGAPQKFAPHGISLYVGTDGKKTLAVVNHGDGESVEIFDVVDESISVHGDMNVEIQHRRTVKDPLFRSLNDVALIGPDAFYVTNDHYYGEGFMRQVEDYGMLKKTFAVYFDGTKASVATKDLTYANGIAVNHSGDRVYVAETTKNVMRTFARNGETGALTPLEALDIDVGTGLDNIDVAPDGTLFLGAHPKLLMLVEHFKDPRKLSPSEVVHLTPSAKGWAQKTVFLDDGRRMSGISVAARHEGNLVLGSILGKDILVCPYTDGEIKVDVEVAPE